MLTLLSIKFLYSENKSKNTFHHLSLYTFDPTLPLGIVIWTTLNPHYLMMPHIISAVFWSNGFWKKFTPENHELNKLESTLGGSFYISFSFFGEIVFLNEDLKKKIFSLSIPIITDNFMNKTAIVVHSTPRILIWTNLNVY